MKIKPINGRILVKEPETFGSVSEGGIVLATDKQEDTIQCKVIDVYEGCVDIQPGDTVVITKLAGTNVNQDGERLLMVKEEQVLVVLNDE